MGWLESGACRAHVIKSLYSGGDMAANLYCQIRGNNWRSICRCFEAKIDTEIIFRTFYSLSDICALVCGLWERLRRAISYHNLSFGIRRLCVTQCWQSRVGIDAGVPEDLVWSEAASCLSAGVSRGITHTQLQFQNWIQHSLKYQIQLSHNSIHKFDCLRLTSNLCSQFESNVDQHHSDS